MPNGQVIQNDPPGPLAFPNARFCAVQFVTDVMKPLSINDIIDNEVQNLSGGELQRVAIALALGKPADIYLIDEPSAYLDSEQVRVCLSTRLYNLSQVLGCIAEQSLGDAVLQIKLSSSSVRAARKLFQKGDEKTPWILV